MVVANASLILVGSLLLANYRSDGGRDVYTTLDSVAHPASSASSSAYYAVPQSIPEAFGFDPNEADSTQLLRLGLAPFQVRSIYRYRAKGGRFSTPDDFRRVYRLTNEQWERLSPYIRIAERYRLVAEMPPEEEQNVRFHRASSSRKQVSAHRASPQPTSVSLSDTASDTLTAMSDTLSAEGKRTWRNYPRKLSGDETVDINSADSALLCRVPGIGPYYARRILDYRRRLGGYANVEQLLQIDNFPPDAMAWMEVTDTVSIKRLKVNSLTTRQLMKHPYMGYYRALEIVSHRRIYGRVAGLDVLKDLPHFTEEDILRLEPYLDFD